MWAQLSALIPGFEWSFVLVYLRVQACLLVLPGLGERVVPVRVRAAIAMSVTPLLAAGVPGISAPVGQFATVVQAMSELIIGLSCGMLLRLLVLSIDVASSAIAATASLSQIIGGQNEAAPHPIGNLMHLGGLAILMALGLPIMLIDLLADSFILWPVAAWPDAAVFSSMAVSTLAQGFWLAMLLAAPFTLGGFLFQALSGVINRVMPALPVVFIGSPLAILLALAALAMLTPMLVAIWGDAVLNFTLPRSG